MRSASVLFTRRATQIIVGGDQMLDDSQEGVSIGKTERSQDSLLGAQHGWNHCVQEFLAFAGQRQKPDPAVGVRVTAFHQTAGIEAINNAADC